MLAVGVIGMGFSIFHPEASRIAQLVGGHRRGMAQSVFQVGGNGGSAIGPLLAAIIIIPYGQRSIIWSAIAAFVAGLPLLPVGRCAPPSHRRIHSSQSRAEIAVA